ncbi:hypothetical protein ACFIJ5_10655 [Haloimpatiens sp. FM7330]|uniref:hypothetical protein n=1 Tax=Haloimpatiens sp. FM7330 TaxID=3298610 RepID=UPI003632C9F4
MDTFKIALVQMNSLVWNPLGKLVESYKKDDENIIFFDLDLESLNNIREGKSGHMKNPFYLKDRRGELYQKYITL